MPDAARKNICQCHNVWITTSRRCVGTCLLLADYQRGHPTKQDHVASVPALRGSVGRGPCVAMATGERRSCDGCAGAGSLPTPEVNMLESVKGAAHARRRETIGLAANQRHSQFPVRLKESSVHVACHSESHEISRPESSWEDLGA